MRMSINSFIIYYTVTKKLKLAVPKENSNACFSDRFGAINLLFVDRFQFRLKSIQISWN